MKKLLTYLFVVSMAALTASCSLDSSFVNEYDLPVNGIELPRYLSAQTGDEVTFRVFGEAPNQDDKLVFVCEEGETVINISLTTDKNFSFVIPEKFYTDSYTMYVERNGIRKKIGLIDIDVFLPINQVPAASTTVYGMVLRKGRPVANAVVSDGYEVVTTNEEGVFEIASQKKHGYVFVSVPSGCTPKRDGALPLLHQYLVSDAQTLERVDFNLLKDEGQDQHTMVVMGDIHLANRNNDINQFANFVNDLNTYMSKNKSQKFYGLTLGDLAWDQYWIPNKYDLTNYAKDLSKLNNITIFNTIGNHDHEQDAAGDFLTVSTYKSIIGPTYYSFNIGKVHYVCLDDIECTNTGAGDRTYNTKIVQEQIDWLQKDLQYVSETTPVVISMHAPMYNETGTARLTNYDKVLTAVGARPCHIMTGHTHIMYNVEKEGHYEHNAGAVCATWWWTGKETPGIHVSSDGTPGGYLLFEVDGTDFKWIYKATGQPITHQFRTFDRNAIQLTSSKYVPDANNTYVEKFNNADYVKAYSTVSTSNEVYINVWNYDSSWTVEVKENGTDLAVERVNGFDPLHTIAYPAKRTNANKDVTFPTTKTTHMFKVTATAPDTKLTIKVTDRFGNVYTQEMERPKEFTVENYLK